MSSGYQLFLFSLRIVIWCVLLVYITHQRCNRFTLVWASLWSASATFAWTTIAALKNLRIFVFQFIYLKQHVDESSLQNQAMLLIDFSPTWRWKNIAKYSLFKWKGWLVRILGYSVMIIALLPVCHFKYDIINHVSNTRY